MNLLTTFKELLVNFCRNTNIHGFSYIVQSDRWKIERLFWFLCVVVSLTLTGLLVHKLILEDQRNPTIIYTDQNVVHVTDILFPSVSIAPGLILKTPLKTGIDYVAIKTQLLTQQISLANLTVIELKRMQIASLIARDEFMSQFNVEIPTDDFIERMRNDFPSYFILADSKRLQGLDRVAQFLYGNWSKEFSMNFTEVLCPTGFCYTFNFPDDHAEIFNLNELSQDFNNTNFYRFGDQTKPKSAYLRQLPYPLKGPKNGQGLYMRIPRTYDFIDNKTMTIAMLGSLKGKASIVLYNSSLVYVPSRRFDILEHSVPINDYFGVSFLIHAPHEVINDHLTRYFILDKYHTLLKITPKLTNYDDTLTEMNVEDRQCYLPNERSLKFFNIYNRINCEHECLSNLTVKSCNCTQFFMVRNEITKICGAFEEKCFRKIEQDFQMSKSSCKCYDLCKRVEYDVQEIAIRQYRSQESPDLHIDFATDKVLPQSRRKQQTLVGFFSLVGGFFGLFAGFSVLSGFEFIYCFILEPILNKMRRNNSRVNPMNDKISPIAATSRYCNEFFTNSSIHGFNHIGNSQKFIVERFIWLILFAIAMTGSHFMVKQVYSSLQLNQIMMTMEGRATPVEKIPFPAITITDRVQMYSLDLTIAMLDIVDAWKVGKSRFDRVFNRMKQSGINNTYNEIYATLCHEDRASDLLEHFDFDYKYPSDFVETMKKLLSNREFWDNSQKSLWNSAIDPPYAETLTVKGIGHTFNMVNDEKLLNFTKLTPDHHYYYKDKSRAETFPWKTTADTSHGLSVEVIRIKDSDGCSNNFFAIHGFNELPIGIKFNKIEFENAYDVLITPNFVTVDDDLKLIEADERKCYLEGERTLKYYKIYTKKNCEMECLSHVAFKTCGCVPFYFVRDAEMTICDFKRFLYCIMNLDDTLPVDDYDYLYQNESVCNCYPLCNTITYSYEVYENYNKIPKNFNKRNNASTTVIFRYKDGEHFALLRYQPYKLVDLLSYVGGILGLFAGISVLSIVEIFYYFTLRAASDLLKHILKIKMQNFQRNR